MRRTLIGLAAVGALVVAGGCGDGDDSASDDDGGSGASSEEFCSTFQDLMVAANSGDTDPQAAEQTLLDLEPPEEIADEWEEYLPLVTEAGDVDANDPEAQAEYQSRLAEASESASAINEYLADECGISGADSGGGAETGSADPNGGDVTEDADQADE